MTDIFIIELLQLFFKTTALIGAPIIITTIVVGVVVNILTTVTQMKDQALVFVPKVVAVGVALVLCVPWYIQVMQNFTETVYGFFERATM